jgi:hypothetical protein
MKVLRSALLATVGAALVFTATEAVPSAEERPSVLARAQVWRATDIPTMNITAGPAGPGAFALQADVECNYLDKKLSGRSPKFACMIGENDELKVKYGGTNGEVYGEVLASRLLWALGFGADHMYSVRIICRGCPAELGGIVRENGDRVFDPATIERKMPAAELSDAWGWGELEAIDERAGGAPRAHRDALKLLAVFIQHTDSKPEQQRMVCLDGPAAAEQDPEDEGIAPCARPFLIIQDVGVTFGRASTFNDNTKSSVNLSKWFATPVWKDDTGRCVGNLPQSFTGTLDDPVISEGGRQFLASLLEQLSDDQIRDLFEVSRVTLRVRKPGDARSGFPTVDEWVSAFKQKRTEIVNRRCG